jgi:hypothetical protein
VKFSATPCALKTFLHSQQEHDADRTTHFLFCILVERSLTSPVSFALCSSSRRGIVQAETYIERQMRLEILSTQVVGIFSGVKRALFFSTDGPLLCRVPSSKRPGDLFVWQMIRLETQMRLCGPHEITAWHTHTHTYTHSHRGAERPHLFYTDKSHFTQT